MLKIKEGLIINHSDTFVKPAIEAFDDISHRLAFDNSIQANIITIVITGKIARANNAACKLLGYSKKELLTKSRSDIFDLSGTNFQKNLIRQTARGQASGLIIAVKRDGKQIPCEITSAVFMNDNGIELAITTIVDISEIVLHQNAANEKLQILNEELKASKKELQNSNEKLNTVNQKLSELNENYNLARLYSEAIVTTIHEPLLILDEDFRVKSANESFYKTFRLTEKETIGSVLFELENNRWEIPDLRSHLIQVQMGKEKFLEWDVNYTFPSAGKRTICFKAQPFKKENGKRKILLALNDITTRKEKENVEKKNADDLVKILENIPQITLTTNPDGSVTYFNKFFLNYSGMTFDEALKKGWEPLIKPEMLDEFKKLWSKVLETGEEFKMELQLKNKNENTYRWHLYRASPIRNDEGIIISWVAAATDLHDRITREQEKDEFMSIASHELKTPLTTAKAYIQLLELSMEETNNKDLIYAQKAGASINRLNNLIGELLDVSKIQNGKLNLNITTFDFDEMMLSAIEDVQCVSPTHAITKRGEIHKEIKGDKDRLQQVIINLLSNAVKYSPQANKVFVNVTLKNNEIRVSVKDRGIGIRKENLWKIFERYYREEQRAIHFQGLGIGLYISYEIIQRHEGRLWAEINGGRGSTFFLTVPISP